MKCVGCGLDNTLRIFNGKTDNNIWLKCKNCGNIYKDPKSLIINKYYENGSVDYKFTEHGITIIHKTRSNGEISKLTSYLTYKDIKKIKKKLKKLY